MILPAALVEHAACRGADPSRFDHTAWSVAAEWTILDYCSVCPVTRLCERTVIGDSPSWFDGIAGGKVWSNGRPLRYPKQRRR